MKNYLSITFFTLILSLSSCSYMSLSESGTLSIKQGNGETTSVEYFAEVEGCKECTVGEITNRINKIVELYMGISTVPTSCLVESVVISSYDDGSGSMVAIGVDVSRKNAFGVRLAPEHLVFVYDENGTILSLVEDGKQTNF